MNQVKSEYFFKDNFNSQLRKGFANFFYKFVHCLFNTISIITYFYMITFLGQKEMYLKLEIN